MHATSPQDALAQELGYAGDMDAAAAWAVLKSQPEALLVDVRTEPEWVFAGFPDLSSLDVEPLLLSFRTYPSMQMNPDFMPTLVRLVEDRATPLLFLCRTGGRSREAAIMATAAGFSQCYNLSDGFDGALNAAGQRGQLAGWRAAGLPWRQQ